MPGATAHYPFASASPYWTSSSSTGLLSPPTSTSTSTRRSDSDAREFATWAARPPPHTLVFSTPAHRACCSPYARRAPATTREFRTALRPASVVPREFWTAPTGGRRDVPPPTLPTPTSPAFPVPVPVADGAPCRGPPPAARAHAVFDEWCVTGSVWPAPTRAACERQLVPLVPVAPVRQRRRYSPAANWMRDRVVEGAPVRAAAGAAAHAFTLAMS
ncbi:hypothetical protein GGF32_001138 [Allomyces javanicus]|nr:hypothetical protein GGF32_001138 [Allomyces javanicus]